MHLEHLRRVIRVNQNFVEYMGKIEEGAEVEDGEETEITARERYDR
jgi:hypothetical protein